MRPQPPAELLSLDGVIGPSCIPAPDVAEWMQATFIQEGSPLENEEHAHLRFAKIGVVWCAVPLHRNMMSVAGQAEIPAARGNAWAKARHDQQLSEWFGEVPDFLITLDAAYASRCSDAAWLALIEHELAHCGQNRDEFGAPKFRQDGTPSFGIRGHDVEQFVSVVRRYGMTAAGVRDMVEAANLPPEIAQAEIDFACGTCGR